MHTRFRALNRTAVASLLAFGLAACGTAESSDAPESQRPAETADPAPAAEAAPAVAAGTQLTFLTDEPISTDANVAGDLFSATLNADVVAADGTVLVPAGSESRWEVTRATNDDGEGNAVLAFRLSSLHAAGEWRAIDATVVSTDLNVDEKDSNKETAAKVAIGAAAGALVGQILGKDSESTLKGAAVGTAMGTVVALSTRGGNARMDAGSAITVELDEALAVS